MLTQEQIENEGIAFDKALECLKDIPGGDVDAFHTWLRNTDFYTAPASTRYHASYEGGLVEHELNVLNIMTELANEYVPGKYSQASLTVVALCHDLFRIGFYELSSKNEKRYYDGGSKKDAIGNFDWISTKSYRVKDAEDRFSVGNGGFSSCLIASRYFPLTDEEMVAIDYSSMDDTGKHDGTSEVLGKFNLATLLKTADTLATFIVDGKPDSGNE